MFKTIQSRFITYFLGSTVLFVFALVALGYVLGKGQFLDIAINNSLKISNLYAQNVGVKFEKKVVRLEDAAGRPAIMEGDPASIIPVLLALKASDPLFVNTVYIDAAGRSLNQQGRIIDVSDRPFFHEVMKGEKDSVLSHPILGRRTGTPIVVLTVPVRAQNGSVKACVGVSIDLMSLSRSMEDIKLAGDSYGWIIDEYGTIITHPDPDFPLRYNIHRAQEIGFPGLEAIAEETSRSRMGYGRYWDDRLKQPKLVTYARIPNTPGWTLFITTLEKDIFKNINEIIRTVITTGLGLLILFILLVVQMTRSVTRPINRLTKAVESSSGRSFTQLDLPDSDDEIGRLTHAYRGMTSTLEAYTQELETMVEDRTQDLRELNKQLNTKNEELGRTNEDLFELATKDTLTGLLNRRAADLAIRQEMNRSERFGTPLSLMILDLDRFKRVNDLHGHDVGDEILGHVADTLRHICRKSDVPARWGGEEFLMLVPETTTGNAVTLAEKLRIETMSKCLAESGPVTISIGVATYRQGEQFETWFRRADKALYTAKHNGRNRVEADAQDLHEQASSRFSTTLLRLNWDDRFETGIEKIDVQHRRLITLSNAIIDASITERDRVDMRRLLEELKEETVRHFADEETLLMEMGLSVATEHAREHAQLTADLDQRLNQFHAGKIDGHALLKFICLQLVLGHMLGADQEYAAELQARKRDRNTH